MLLHRYSTKEIEFYIYKQIIKAFAFYFQNKWLEVEENYMRLSYKGHGFHINFKNINLKIINNLESDDPSPFSINNYSLRINLWEDMFTHPLTIKHIKRFRKILDTDDLIMEMSPYMKNKTHLSNVINFCVSYALGEHIPKTDYPEGFNPRNKKNKQTIKTISRLVKPFKHVLENDFKVALSNSRKLLEPVLRKINSGWNEILLILRKGDHNNLKKHFLNAYESLPISKDVKNGDWLNSKKLRIKNNIDLSPIINEAMQHFTELYCGSLILLGHFKILNATLFKLRRFLSAVYINNVLALVLSRKEVMPDFLVIELFVFNLRQGIFSDRKIENTYFDYINVLDGGKQIDIYNARLLLNEACKRLSAENQNWFVDFLNKRAAEWEINHKSKRNPFKIYYTNLYLKPNVNVRPSSAMDELKNIFPKLHEFFCNFPTLIFDDHSNSPLFYLLNQNNPLKNMCDEIIREKLSLPFKGSTKINECRVLHLLKTHFPKIKWVREYSPDFLIRQRYDFYSFEHNIAIELHGLQHYKPIDFFGGINALIQTQKRDAVKMKLSQKYGVKLLIIDSRVKDRELLEAVMNAIKCQQKIKKRAS